MALQKCMAFFYFATDELEMLKSPYVPVGDAFQNDGRCDKKGRFVVGGCCMDFSIPAQSPVYAFSYCKEGELNGKVLTGIPKD